MRKKYLFAFLAILIAAAASFAIDTDYILYKDRQVPIPLTYVPARVITYLGPTANYLDVPDDLFIDDAQNMYVADTGNNRIVKLTLDGNAVGVFTGPDDMPLAGPRGIFVDADGDMYVADTDNSRLVHLSPEGGFVEEFVKPESALLEGFDFQPVKVYVSTINSIFVLNRTNYLGIMEIDAEGKFVGYSGSTQVGFNLLRLIIRMFASAEQRRQLGRRVAPPYSNLVMDRNDLLFATTITVETNQIVRLNAVGINTYKSYSYGELVPDFLTGDLLIPEFVDLAVDSKGIISALEKRSGRIYQYDQEGNLLTVIGEKGNRLGAFKTPVSICVDADGNLYVLDSQNANIQVFEPTSFIQLVHSAVNLYIDGRYSEALKVWKQIQLVDANYKLAHIGKGKALARQGDYTAAMEEHKKGLDRPGYSEAFVKYRFELARKYFGLVFFGVIALAVGLVFLIIRTKRMADGELKFIVSHTAGVRRTSPLKLVPMIIFHPGDAFLALRSWRDRANYLPALLLFILIIAVRVVEIFAIHFPVAVLDPREANLLAEISRMLLPVITWVLACYAITAIMDGESLFREALTAAAYCMIPYILFTLPIALSTHLMSQAETGLFNTLRAFIWLWVILLFLASVYKMNTFTFGKTIGVCLLSIVGVAAIWLLVLIFFTLTDQLFGFGVEIKEEIGVLIFGIKG